jgi:outer membrane protein TolC
MERVEWNVHSVGSDGKGTGSMIRKLDFRPILLMLALVLGGCAMPKARFTRTFAPQAYPAKTLALDDSSAQLEGKHESVSSVKPVVYEAVAGEKDKFAEQEGLVTVASAVPVSEESRTLVNGQVVAPQVVAPQVVAPEVPATSLESAPVPVNLPTVLAMIGGQHPVVGFAQSRVQEAYAQLDRAKVMWLPSIQTGFNYRRRDGNYQAVDGSIVDVNLNSMNYGLGAGAVAAGSPTRPGIVAQFHLADALFTPKVAEKTAWAREHAASAILNRQLLDGGIAYLDLLEAYQDHEIVSESFRRNSELAKITADFAAVGAGLRSDADRAATELAMVQSRQLTAREGQLIASTRLARVLSIPMSSAILPQDTIAIPLELMPQLSDEPSLISTGLATRPELKESQALVAAACAAYKREKQAPFVPSVLLGFSTTSFGGGLGRDAENFGGRYDVDAMMVWETRNLGFGEGAARRERSAQVHQATFTKLRMMDQVAQEIAEANIQIGMRKQQVELSQQAIAHARDSYARHMERIKEGQGLPIEALQAIQALENAERAYLRAVTSYNRSQLQLQWALGWPITSVAVNQNIPGTF